MFYGEMRKRYKTDVTFFRAISKYAIEIIELMTEFIKTMF